MRGLVILYDWKLGFQETFEGNYVSTSFVKNEDKVWCIGCYKSLPYKDCVRHLEDRHLKNSCSSTEECYLCRMAFDSIKLKRKHEDSQHHKDVIRRKSLHFCGRNFTLSEYRHGHVRAMTREQFELGAYPPSVECPDMDYEMVLRTYENSKALLEKGLILETDIKRLAISSAQVGEEEKEEDETEVFYQREFKTMQDRIVEKRLCAITLLMGNRFDNEGKRAMACGPICEDHLNHTAGYVANKLEKVWLREDKKECVMCKQFRKCVNRRCDTYKKATTICVNVDDLQYLKNDLPIRTMPAVLKLGDVKHYRNVVDFNLYYFDPKGLAFKLKDGCELVKPEVEEPTFKKIICMSVKE